MAFPRLVLSDTDKDTVEAGVVGVGLWRKLQAQLGAAGGSLRRVLVYKGLDVIVEAVRHGAQQTGLVLIPPVARYMTFFGSGGLATGDSVLLAWRAGTDGLLYPSHIADTDVARRRASYPSKQAFLNRITMLCEKRVAYVDTITYIGLYYAGEAGYVLYENSALLADGLPFSIEAPYVLTALFGTSVSVQISNDKVYVVAVAWTPEVGGERYAIKQMSVQMDNPATLPIGPSGFSSDAGTIVHVQNNAVLNPFVFVAAELGGMLDDFALETASGAVTFTGASAGEFSFEFSIIGGNFTLHATYADGIATVTSTALFSGAITVGGSGTVRSEGALLFYILNVRVTYTADSNAIAPRIQGDWLQIFDARTLLPGEPKTFSPGGYNNVIQPVPNYGITYSYSGIDGSLGASWGVHSLFGFVLRCSSTEFSETRSLGGVSLGVPPITGSLAPYATYSQYTINSAATYTYTNVRIHMDAGRLTGTLMPGSVDTTAATAVATNHMVNSGGVFNYPVDYSGTSAPVTVTVSATAVDAVGELVPAGFVTASIAPNGFSFYTGFNFVAGTRPDGMAYTSQPVFDGVDSYAQTDEKSDARCVVASRITRTTQLLSGKESTRIDAVITVRGQSSAVAYFKSPELSFSPGTIGTFMPGLDVSGSYYPRQRDAIFSEDQADAVHDFGGFTSAFYDELITRNTVHTQEQITLNPVRSNDNYFGGLPPDGIGFSFIQAHRPDADSLAIAFVDLWKRAVLQSVRRYLFVTASATAADASSAGHAIDVELSSLFLPYLGNLDQTIMTPAYEIWVQDRLADLTTWGANLKAWLVGAINDAAYAVANGLDITDTTAESEAWILSAAQMMHNDLFSPRAACDFILYMQLSTVLVL